LVRREPDVGVWREVLGEMVEEILGAGGVNKGVDEGMDEWMDEGRRGGRERRGGGRSERRGGRVERGRRRERRIGLDTNCGFM
jgi:hypothetical protein